MDDAEQIKQKLNDFKRGNFEPSIQLLDGKPIGLYIDTETVKPLDETISKEVYEKESKDYSYLYKIGIVIFISIMLIAVGYFVKKMMDRNLIASPSSITQPKEKSSSNNITQQIPNLQELPSIETTTPTTKTQKPAKSLQQRKNRNSKKKITSKEKLSTTDIFSNNISSIKKFISNNQKYMPK